MGADTNSRQAIKILMDCILISSYDKLHAEVNRYNSGGSVISSHLKKALTDVAGLSGDVSESLLKM